MTEEIRHTILLVDDEQSILKALQRLFRRQDYDILTASSGMEGLELLQAMEKPLSMIISDQRMPGMNGAEFLEKAKAVFPEAIRYLLTGYSDVDAIVDSINKGEIHKYITKPWNDEDLILQVRQGIEHFSLVAENKRLLAVTQEQNKKLYEFGQQMDRKVKERTQKVLDANKTTDFLNKELELNLYNTVRAFAALNELHMTLLKGHGKRVSRVACKIAEKMGFDEKEVNQIEIASVLHDIGKSGFSEKMQKVMDVQGINENELRLYKKHPEDGQAVIAFVNRLDEAGFIVRHHHERYDGQGFPDMLAGDDIPIGARIVAVADIYDRITGIEGNNKYLGSYLASLEVTPDHMTDKEQGHNSAVEYIRKHSFTKYDPDVVKAFLTAVDEMGIKPYSGEKVPVYDLEEGMIIERALYTKKGRFLVPHKTKLTPEIIDKLKTIHRNRDLDDYIHII